jgi:hypothetical protein
MEEYSPTGIATVRILTNSKYWPKHVSDRNTFQLVLVNDILSNANIP